MNNLQILRELIDVKPKTMANLLNVTTHTYNAYERETMFPSNEVVEMLSIIYEVDKSVIIGECELNDENIKSKLCSISKLTEEEKYKVLATRLLGDDVKLSRKNIRDKRKAIKDSLLT
jgi:DNA-binding XRE family transcriptional regulator